jgi:hypothetical protein
LQPAVFLAAPLYAPFLRLPSFELPAPLFHGVLLCVFHLGVRNVFEIRCGGRFRGGRFRGGRFRGGRFRFRGV